MAKSTSADGESAGVPRTVRRRIGQLRGTIPVWQSLLFGGLSIVVVLGIWYAVTWGERSEDRLISAVRLPSPAETFAPARLHSLWFDRALTRQTLASLSRVVLGFTCATLIGVPLGILCACFPRVGAFFAPMTIFGRNIPMAALIPLIFILLPDPGEQQKIAFIFLAAVAFVISDTATAIGDVASRYIDTAFTLGASRRQTIMKVLVPLAFPDIINSLRLLFGLAFGYIMLAEVIQEGNAVGGLGKIIDISFRLGPREHVYLVLFVIPLVAFAIDRMLWVVQTQLFPYRYGGAGALVGPLKMLIGGWEAFHEKMFPSPWNAEYERLLGTGEQESGDEERSK